MNATAQSSSSSSSSSSRLLSGPGRPRRLRLLAVLLIPLLLVLHAPVLAAIVPGALLTVASLEAMGHERQALAPATHVVGADDLRDLQRIAAATAITATSRRVG